MARMIPSTIHQSVRSAAERRLFDVFRNAPATDDWVCLHSLGLARHQAKRRGEVDFVLLTRKGVFVLEVKGGRVARQGGVWIHTDRWGSQVQRHESPFDQASSGMFALERDIRDRFADQPRMSRLLFGYGVVLPDVLFEESGADGDRRIVYDARDRRQPITSYIQRLATFAREQDPGLRYSPSEDDIQALVTFLRGDFDLVPQLSAQLDDAASNLLKLTEEQYAVLEALDSFPRLIVQGGAGTGKTLLAAECAVREARSGSPRVLFLCFNRLLAAFLEGVLKPRCQAGRVEVKSAYSFLNQLIHSSSLASEFREKCRGQPDDVIYKRLFPEYAVLAIVEGVETYDVLVLDEAQDLMNDAALDIFDGCLKGGLEAGRWRFFCDANNQGSVYGTFNEAAFTRLMRFGHSTVVSTNRRNTRQIADETTMLSGPKVPAAGVVSGVPVEYSWFGDSDEQPARLGKILSRLAAQGVAPGRITVLSPLSGANCCAAALDDTTLAPVTEENAGAVVAGTCPATTFASVSSFKGLENDYIVLTDVKELGSDWWRSVVYVGMSRARAGLCLLLPQSLKPAYEENVRRWITSRG